VSSEGESSLPVNILNDNVTKQVRSAGGAPIDEHHPHQQDIIRFSSITTPEALDYRLLIEKQWMRERLVAGAPRGAISQFKKFSPERRYDSGISASDKILYPRSSRPRPQSEGKPVKNRRETRSLSPISEQLQSQRGKLVFAIPLDITPTAVMETSSVTVQNADVSENPGHEGAAATTTGKCNDREEILPSWLVLPSAEDFVLCSRPLQPHIPLKKDRPGSAAGRRIKVSSPPFARTQTTATKDFQSPRGFISLSQPVRRRDIIVDLPAPEGADSSTAALSSTDRPPLVRLDESK
jgi:hypothetical protein